MSAKKSKFKRFLLILALIIGFMFLSLFLFATIVYNKYDLDTAKLTSLNNGIKVYSSSGVDNTLYNTNRSIVEIETLPEYVKNAFIDIEDKRFYSHNGYDLKRIVKSSLVNFSTKSKSQGASTISQQLIKNAILTNEKTYSRKVQEIVLSMKMEKKYSKDEILEMYLNTIYFGSNAYGIENASKTYFNKSSKDLTLNEACCLAGLIKSPKKFSPKENYENSIKRRNLVAENMLKNNSISREQYEIVVNAPIYLNMANDNDTSYEKEAIFEACQLLNVSERDLINKNYKIITFKQDDLQEKVILENNSVINVSEDKTNTSLDSLSIVSNANGEVLAYYSNSNYNLHNLTRQPASTLKPLAVYLPCFKHNILSPASLILDEEINYNGFSPKNADNTYHGYVSTRYALSNSLNVPTVKALDYLGVKKAKTELENLGINITYSDLNLSLALGATKNGVKLIDLLSAYLTLANYGEYRKLCFVDKILDENDNIIYSHEDYKVKVTDENSCFMVTDILKDCAKTGTAKRLNSLNLPIASKTGTATNNNANTDLFNIAYTTEHAMLTWVADISEKTLPATLFSSSVPTDINKQICAYLYSNHTPADFIKPEGVACVGYDLNEYEKNHLVLQPNHNISRYIEYDYFKQDNLPDYAPVEDNLNFTAEVNNYGCILSFDANKLNGYRVIKKTQQSTNEIAHIYDKSGICIIEDKNIFKHDYIEYYVLCDENQTKSQIITIKPKDYLINNLAQEMLISKKKWSV